MQVSSKKVSTNVERTVERRFFMLLSEIKDPEEMEGFLREFLSESELTVLSKRLSILYQLSQNTSYKKISNTLKVSSATISSTSDLLKKPLIHTILTKMAIDDWAVRTTKKITRLFSRK